MVDFITKLLVVAGKNTILVVCDKLSKMTYFVVTIKKISVEGLVLWSMPPRGSMEKGKEYDDIIGYAVDSLSQYLI